MPQGIRKIKEKINENEMEDSNGNDNNSIVDSSD